MSLSLPIVDLRTVLMRLRVVGHVVAKDEIRFSLGWHARKQYRQ